MVSHFWFFFSSCFIERLTGKRHHARLFNSHRRRRRSGWCGGAVAVHGTYRRHSGYLANSPHRYDQALPWPAPGACTPHVQILTKSRLNIYCDDCFSPNKEKQINGLPYLPI